MDFSTLSGLLASLLLPVFAINWFVSHFLDNLPTWEALDSQVKSVITLVASIVVGLVAYAILHTVPGTVLDQLQPVYAVIYAIIAAWIAGQAQHQNGITQANKKAVQAAQIRIMNAPQTSSASIATNDGTLTTASSSGETVAGATFQQPTIEPNG